MGNQFEITGRYEQFPVMNMQYFQVEEGTVIELEDKGMAKVTMVCLVIVREIKTVCAHL